MTNYPDIRLRKCTEWNSKIDWFEVVEDCRFRPYYGDEIVIPKGFITDFASVPRWLWSFVPPHGRMTNAAILHDFVYINKIRSSQIGNINARLFADLEFYWNCRFNRVSKIQAGIIFVILRLFGEKWWNK